MRRFRMLAEDRLYLEVAVVFEIFAVHVRRWLLPGKVADTSTLSFIDQGPGAQEAL
jgi:hypothetical protein